MQETDQSEMTSWFQVAGIHGLPYTTWDSAEGIAGASTGYCTHSSVLFPTWHRPYVALFEVSLNRTEAVPCLFIITFNSKFSNTMPGRSQKDMLKAQNRNFGYLKPPLFDLPIGIGPFTMYPRQKC